MNGPRTRENRQRKSEADLHARLLEWFDTYDNRVSLIPRTDARLVWAIRGALVTGAIKPRP